MAKSSKSREVHRSADDGRFVTKKEADKKPREHVKERVPIPKKKK